MAGNKCVYYLCGHTQRNDKVRQFRFPVKDEKRTQIWILHSGNANLVSMSPNTLRKQFLCEKHFKEDLLLRNLQQNAVAIHYKSLLSSDTNVINTYSRSSLNKEESSSITEVIAFLTPDKEEKQVYPSKDGSTPEKWVDNLIELSSPVNNRQKGDLQHREVAPYEPGDKVLVDVHALSDAAKGYTSKFAPRRDGPYLIKTQCSPTTYKIASVSNPNEVIGSYHVSALRPLVEDDNNDEVFAPIRPIRRRGRPKINQEVVIKQPDAQPVAAAPEVVTTVKSLSNG
ncbi:hypothetical protein RN001_001538 [Aquatica leii]|uniref:THAP-type domain-containing protein n=1 Tax=Aquatica leii TaxID=1421715 RepID=A0AAN7PG42_9COLE|nr:hypothetical protein RN001_001538 [Aquatica leii]